jgi:hypothetical protein
MHLEKIVPTAEQIDILYIQLVNRVSSISHKEIPTLDEHREFVINNPYRAWFIIKDDGSAIGNIYVQLDNSLGLNCTDDITERKIGSILTMIMSELSPLEAVSSVRYGSYFLNVASSNLSLQKKLSNLGLMESQRTYVFAK